MMNTVPSPTQDELACFYNSLDESGKPSLLFIVPEYCDKFVINTDLLFPLFDIYRKSGIFHLFPKYRMEKFVSGNIHMLPKHPNILII